MSKINNFSQFKYNHEGMSRVGYDCECKVVDLGNNVWL